MPPARPLVDPETGAIDLARVRAEAVPIAKLVGLFGALAVVPFALALLFSDVLALGVVFAAVAQFVLAVGAGIVLLYVFSRALELADE